MAVVCVSIATNQTENRGNIYIAGNTRMCKITVLPQRQISCINFPTDSDIWLYQGDLLLTKDQRSGIEASSNPNDPYAPMYAFVKSEDALWPNGILYYVLDDSLNGIHVAIYIHHLIISYTTDTLVVRVYFSHNFRRKIHVSVVHHATLSRSCRSGTKYNSGCYGGLYNLHLHQVSTAH